MTFILAFIFVAIILHYIFGEDPAGSSPSSTTMKNITANRQEQQRLQDERDDETLAAFTTYGLYCNMENEIAEEELIEEMEMEDDMGMFG